MAGRKLHLIDAENVFASGRMKFGEFARRWNIYSRQAVTIGPRDVIIIASGPRLAPVIEAELPDNLTKLVRPGTDGADLALIDAFALVFPLGVFDEVVIASGDRSFISVAKTAIAAGARAHVVIGGGSPSTRLLKAASRRTYIRSKTQLRKKRSARSKLVNQTRAAQHPAPHPYAV